MIFLKNFFANDELFSVDISRSYPFYYNPGFKAIEDGWTLFQPEEEFSKLIYSADSEWRISYVNIEYNVNKSRPDSTHLKNLILDLFAFRCANLIREPS